MVQVLFSILFLSGIILFSLRIGKIIKRIKLGLPQTINDSIGQRLKNTFRVAIGQSKMVKKPIAGTLHILVYVGFVIVNIELIEILLDGFTGNHRIFNNYLQPFYPILISFIEIIALLVIFACLIFLVRRNIMKIKRFHKPEMTRWPRLDANIILIFEILLMLAFLFMNAADTELQTRNLENYSQTGTFTISRFIALFFGNISADTLIIIERSAWWLHIIGVMAFLNYLPYSKHFHILIAIPNVYFSKIGPLAMTNSMKSVTNEVNLMLFPEKEIIPDNVNGKFGASDVSELSWKNLLDSYSCTECGRCTDVCPANITGKKLSPRKLIMDVRDRLEVDVKSDNSLKLLHGYIKPEELWACTTCNACTNVCPVNIDHVSLILDLRRYLVMEEASVPSSLNNMFANIENNGAPWQYPALDRDKWTEDIFIKKQ